MKIFDSLETAGKVNYSVDVEDLLSENKITKSTLYGYINRMIGNEEDYSDADFGSLDEATSNKFKEYMKAGNRDVYGIFNDVIVYYNAQKDEVVFVTPFEFQNYYIADWTNKNRVGRGEKGMKRMSTKRPDQMLREGQRREIIKNVSALEGGNKKGLATVLRTAYGVYPYMTYERVIKALNEEQLETFKRLSEEKNIPIEKLYAAFGHQHAVQNKNVENSFNWVVKHINDPNIFTTDAIENDFTEKTVQGYTIVSTYKATNNDSRIYAIVKRKTDYIVCAGYDPKTGSWDAGYYDFPTYDDAYQMLFDKYHYDYGYKLKPITL